MVVGEPAEQLAPVSGLRRVARRRRMALGHGWFVTVSRSTSVFVPVAWEELFTEG